MHNYVTAAVKSLPSS